MSFQAFFVIQPPLEVLLLVAPTPPAT
jgi:hypothetical protein